MTVKVNIRVKDKGLGEFIASFNALGRREHARLGLFDAKNEETAIIGAVHEYGAPDKNIPQRSYMRATFDENQQKYTDIARKELAAAAERPQIAVKNALNAVGHTMETDVKRAIIKRIPPPLSEKTIARKRRLGLPRPSIPLYATGQLYEAIAYRTLTER